MRFNDHSNLGGKHAFLSPSQNYWINYPPDKLRDFYRAKYATLRGSQLHEFAAQAITLGIKLKGESTTLAMYVNDAIGYKMTPEQTLYYSDNCFGTADAISFRRKMLRIHDLKTGVHKASMKQLVVYAALFCLEYKINPGAINTELRIYQNNEIVVHNPSEAELIETMGRIEDCDRLIDDMNAEYGVSISALMTLFDS